MKLLKDLGKLWDGCFTPAGQSTGKKIDPQNILVVDDNYGLNEGEAVTNSVQAAKNLSNLTRGNLSYNQGSISLRPDGSVEFVDLTMAQVKLAKTFALTPEKRQRLDEINTQWPGGADDVRRNASYVELHQSGELKQRIENLKEIRAKDEFQVFLRGRRKGSMRIGGFNLNVGEEREISGTQGSGVVYFSGCAMACSGCQYADIAQLNGGVELGVERLADVMLKLQNDGAHNIHLMTPSHHIVEILEAVDLAAEKGLKIPLVYNTGGYEDLNALKELDGVVDIYLPDVKFGSNEAGQRYGGTSGYWDNVQEAVREMYRQVGALKTDDRDVAYKGLFVRHLVLPNDVAETDNVAAFVADLGPDIPVNVMPQWAPTFASKLRSEIHREVSDLEFQQARGCFEERGVRIWKEYGE